MRESMRWGQMQALQQAEAERWQHVREAGLKGKQNKSSEHYNIISLQYHPTKEGEKLRYKVRLDRTKDDCRHQGACMMCPSVWWVMPSWPAAQGWGVLSIVELGGC